MNKILQLFDEEYAKEFFTRKILPRYPEFDIITRIEIRPHKNLVWETTYHVVIEFLIYLAAADGKERRISIYCTAHSSEPRKNVYEGLKFLWANSFSSGNLTVPRPLSYSEHFHAAFYQGVEGHNLYHYIRDNKQDEIRDIIKLAAHWFAKLHDLPGKETKNFSEPNSRIRSTIPGRDHILEKIEERYPEKRMICQKILDTIIKREEDFLSQASQLWLVHGDAHPENIIKTGTGSIAVIDFTDLSLTDFARDLGSFTQQLEYMCHKKISDRDFAARMKALFLEEYAQARNLRYDADLEYRIETYYLWTTFRTAVFFLIGYLDKPERAEQLFEQIREKLSI